MALTPSIFGLDVLAGGPNIVTRDLATYGLISPEWGIFNSSGNAVVKATNVVGFDYKTEWTVSDYPLERGSFESYNKVKLPYDARVRFSAGGSFANRSAFIASVDAIAGDLKLYDVVTPEKTWLSANIIHYDLARSATSGAGLVVIDVWLQQIRVTAQATPTNTAAPSGATATDGGQVQTQTPTAAQTATVDSALTRSAIAAGA